MAADGFASSAPETANTRHISPHSFHQSPPSFEVSFAPPTLAADAPFVTYLANLVKAVYASSEAEFWQPGKFTRCSAAELSSYIQSSQIALAWRPGSSRSDPANLMGCVRLHMLDGSTAACGMLVCDPAVRSSGVGRGLIEFAEEWARCQGAEQVQVEVIIGDGWVHAFKERLAEWYERRGYRLLRVGSVREEVPDLANILARRARVKVLRKVL
ncbi:Uncharacterized protein YxbD [Madurella mycetomatis]|uniref:Uncharacterized protein YxbD n=1 Tax=Madurella mycetomatis TaxID=100816 RepID=A0A175WGA0_9PEZI|nr:Uncharacterized protein YxbD [Madurella mycetomatis]